MSHEQCWGVTSNDQRCENSAMADATAPAPASGTPGLVHEGEEEQPGPMDWLLAALRQASEELMAGDGKPLQKANALARLANQYLKAFQIAALRKENRALKRRVAELEQDTAEALPADPALLAGSAIMAPSRQPAAHGQGRAVASAPSGEPGLAHSGRDRTLAPTGKHSRKHRR